MFEYARNSIFVRLVGYLSRKKSSYIVVQIKYRVGN
jgi:hypothetical protein